MMLAKHNMKVKQFSTMTRIGIWPYEHEYVGCSKVGLDPFALEKEYCTCVLVET